MCLLNVCVSVRSDCRVYSNRAACYVKIMGWQNAINDCQKCIAMDPTFGVCVSSVCAICVCVRVLERARECV